MVTEESSEQKRCTIHNEACPRMEVNDLPLPKEPTCAAISCVVDCILGWVGGIVITLLRCLDNTLGYMII
jgi:hypothetical protein